MKKKIFIALLTLVCALTCSFSFIACGDEKDDGKVSDTEQGDNKDDGNKDDGNKDDGNGGTSDREDKAAVTATEWVQVFVSTDNYTATSTQGGTDSIVKADKDKFGVSASGYTMIYAKDGGSYYVYSYTNSQWMRMSVAEYIYKAMADSMRETMSAFKDKMPEFTYSEGVYSAAEISLETSDGATTVKNVKIKFENGKLTGMDYYAVVQGNDVHCVISNVGTTTVEVPAQYTEIDMPAA